MQENSPETMPKTETKNKTFVVVSAILLLAIAVIIAVFFNKNQANKDVDLQAEQAEQIAEIQEQGEIATETQQNDAEGTLLFSDLIAQREGSYRCQIENEDGYYIYYFDDQRMAVEVKIPNSYTKTIVDEDFTYTWNVDEKVGTKVANEEDVLEEDLNQEEELVDEEMMEEIPEEDLLPAEDVGPFDPANFVCEPWTVEETVFTLPTDVMFQDLSQL